MKFKYLIIVIIMFVSCENSKNHNSPTYYGNIKEVKTRYFNAITDFGEYKKGEVKYNPDFVRKIDDNLDNRYVGVYDDIKKEAASNIKFNEAGNIEQIEYFNYEGEIAIIDKYFYNDEDKLDKIEGYLKDKQYGLYEYEYFSSGRLKKIKLTQFKNNIKVDSLVYKKLNNKDEFLKILYTGNYINQKYSKYLKFDKDKLIELMFIRDGDSIITNIEYTTDFFQIATTSRKMDSLGLTNNVRYYIDKYGNPIKIEINGKDYLSIEYTYDEQNNWILRKIFHHSKNEVVEIHERTITYF